MRQGDIELLEREIDEARRNKAKADADKAHHEAEKAKFEAEHEKEKMAKTKAETEKTRNSIFIEGAKAITGLLVATVTIYGVYQKSKSG